MTLFEYFNTTNQSKPHFEPHEIFVVKIRSDDCGIVQDLDYDERCSFVERTETCRDHVNIIDYIHFVYCTVSARSETIHWLIMVALLILVCYMFSILGSTADLFLCPSLTVIAQILHMSENLAGVTILAFGNGAPDLFTSLTDMDGDTTILIAEAYGAALFVIGVIAGIIMIIQPFQVYIPIYLRDVIFILFATAYVHNIIYDEYVSLYEGCFVIILYFIYILVVILDQIIITKMAKDVQQKLDMVAAGNADPKLKQELQELKAQGVLEVLGKKSHISLDIEQTKSALFVGESANTNLFSQFLNSLNPIDREEWEEAGVIGKAIIIVKAPVIFLLLLSMPIVDYNLPVHGWSKLLNVAQIFITPAFSIVVLRYYDVVFFQVPLLAYVAIVAVPLMITVFLTSRTDTPPVYHVIYAVLAMAVSIIVIQVVASEIVMILDTVGIAAKLTPSFLGSTILAWGNSVGDLMSNIMLSKQGYHKMGFAACYGGPLIIMMLGLGITFVYKGVKSENHLAYIRQGALGPTCNNFLIFVVGFPLMATLAASGQARRSFGIFSIIIYVLFLLYTILGEFELIHPFGTDHTDQRVKMI